MTERHYEEKCPKCGSEEQDYDAYEWSDEFVYQQVLCKKCHHLFTIYSKPEWLIMEGKERGE